MRAGTVLAEAVACTQLVLLCYITCFRNYL